MNALELGQKMAAMVNQGPAGEAEFVTRYYADDVISIEGQGSEEMPAEIQGIEAVRDKHAWWYDNNEVHSTVLEGPYVGHREDQFVMRIVMDMTPKGGERTQMTEVGLYTLKDNRIVQEEYLYLMG
ncbi:MAG: SnoaL-like domain-containing protein [bacterium]